MTGREKTMNDEVSAASLDLAYEYVIHSYDWARDRMDKINGRLQAMQGAVVGVALAVPVFVKAVAGEGTPVGFDSTWFIVSMVLFALAMIVGLIAQAWGTLILAEPKVFHDKYLGFDEKTFKKHALKYAGEHSTKNHETIRRKGHAMSAMAVLFLLGVGALVVWVAVG